MDKSTQNGTSRSNDSVSECYVADTLLGNMVVSLAAYVYASITTQSHEFDRFHAFLFFLTDVLIAGAVVPTLPVG